MVVGRLLSFWETPFSDAMLVSGRVPTQNESLKITLHLHPSLKPQKKIRFAFMTKNHLVGAQP